MIALLLRWAINALGIFVAAAIIPGIDYRDNKALIIVVVVLGLFNAFLKPLLVFFTLPFVVLTLGFGVLVINALLLMLAASIVDGFYVSGFLAAFFGGLIISLINLLLGSVVGESAMPARGRAKKRDDVIDI